MLAQIAGHQDRDMMRQILAVKQLDQKEHVSRPRTAATYERLPPTLFHRVMAAFCSS